MDYLNSILSQQNQKVQLVEEAIPTLCNRLQHANLSSDRRSAVLGLKSFSRQFRESVVEYGLRTLISTLKKDSQNPIIVKAVLETILVLFIRGEGDDDHTRGWISQQSRLQNGKYPSPILMDDISVDQLSMWIADELTNDEEALQLLVDIIQENEDFHIRLYALQLLEALVSTRTIKTKDCLLNIPTAISTLVSLLDDVNDPVRNEAILVLMAVANNNFNIQKLVAFENTFDRLFTIIDEEGGVRGSILVQDCLTLITNLLQYNASNQKYFLETGCVPRLARLLGEPVEEIYEEGYTDENGNPIPLPPITWTEQRLQNMIIALEICKTFVSEDNEFREQNQSNLFQSGVLFIVLKLVFSPLTANEVRSIALYTTGDLIAGNAEIQLQFSQIDVPYLDPTLPNLPQSFDKPAPVTIALLNWALYINSVHTFDIRMGSAHCLHSYFKDNSESKKAFLNDQIKAYLNPNYYSENSEANGDSNGHKETNGIVPGEYNPEVLQATPFANIFSTLMDYDSELKLNPYRLWFSAVVLMYLFEDSDENKELTRNIQIGDAEAGEEVMSSIQAISGLLVTTLDHRDPRISIGYLMLLTFWLFENFEAVNDFLGDTSVLKALLAFLSNNSSESAILVHGMVAILVGTVYEFSTKDSPLSRPDLHVLLTKALGKDNYTLKIKQFRDNDNFKNFDESSAFSKSKDETGLPEIFFNQLYIDLIKENFARIRRALFHDPNVDPVGHITFEAYEELEGKFASLKENLEKEKKTASETKKSLESELSDSKKELENINKKLSTAESGLEELKTNHQTLNEEYEKTFKELKDIESSKKNFESTSGKYFKELQDALKNNSSMTDSIKQLEHRLEESEKAKTKAEDGINKMSRELFQMNKQKKESESLIDKLEREIKSLKTEAAKITSNFESQVRKLQNQIEQNELKIGQLNKQLSESALFNQGTEKKVKELEDSLKDSEANGEHLMNKLRSVAVTIQEMRDTQSSSDEKYVVLEKSLEDIKKEKESLDAELTSLKELNKSDLSSLNEKLKDLEIANKELTEKNSSLLSEISELSDKNSSLSNEVTELTNKNNTLATEIALLKQQLEKSQSDKDLLASNHDDKLKSLIEEKVQLEKTLSDKEKTISTSKIDHETTKKEFDSWKDENTKAVESLTKLLEEKTNEHLSLSELHQKLESDLKDAQESHSNAIKDLNDKADSLHKSLEDKSEKHSTLSELHKKLEAELKSSRESHSKEIGDLNAKSESLSKDIEIKSTKLAELESIQSEHKKAQVKLSDYEKDISSNEDSIKQLKTQIQELEDKLEAQEQEYKQSEEKLKKERDDLSQQLEKVKETLATTLTKQKDLLSENEAGASKLGSLETEKKTLEDKIESLEKEITVLNEQLEKSKEDHEISLKSLKDKEESVTSLKSLLDSQKSLVKNLQKERQTLVEKITANLTISETEIGKLEITIADLEKKLATSVKESNEKLEALAKEKSLSEEKFSEQESKYQKEAEELHDTVIKLKKSIEELENTIQELKSTVELQEKKAKEFEVAVDESKKQIGEKEDELKTLQKELTKVKSSLEKEVKHLKASVEEKEKKINDLETDLELKIKEVEKERAMLSESSETVIKEYSDKINNLEEIAAKSKQDHSTEVAKIQSEKTELSEKIDDLNATLKSLEDKFNVSDKSLKEANEAKAVLEKEKAKLVAEIATSVKNLKAQKEEHESKLLLLNEELGTLQTKNSGDVSTLKTQSKELEDVKKKLEEATSELKSKETELSTLGKSLEESKGSSNKTTEELKSITQALNDSKAAVSAGVESLAREKEVSEGLKTKVDSLLQEVAAEKKAHEKAAKEWTAKNTELESKFGDLTTSSTKLTKEHSDLKKKIEVLETEKKEVEQKNNDLKVELESVKSDSKSLGEVEKDRQAANKKVADLSATIQKLEKEATALNAEIEKLNGKNSELTKLAGDHAVAQDGLKQSEKKIVDLEKELQSTKVELEGLSQKNTDLTKSVEDHTTTQSSLKQSQQQVSELKGELKSLKIELEELNKKNDSLTKSAGDHSTTQSNLQKAQTQVSELEKELKATKSELEKELASKGELEKAHQDLTKSTGDHATVVQQWEQKLAALGKELESTKTQLEKSKQEVDASSKYQKTSESLEKELTELKAMTANKVDLKVHQQKLDDKETEYKKQLESLQAEKSESDSKLQEEIKKLKRKLKQQSENLVPKSELDDLMLLMSDIDDKNKKYKKQLKALNQEVSSDEDDDDDDDDDDEESDEE